MAQTQRVSTPRLTVPVRRPRLATVEALSPEREWKRLARRLGNGAGGYDPREAWRELVTRVRG